MFVRKKPKVSQTDVVTVCCLYSVDVFLFGKPIVGFLLNYIFWCCNAFMCSTNHFLRIKTFFTHGKVNMHYIPLRLVKTCYKPYDGRYIRRCNGKYSTCLELTITLSFYVGLATQNAQSSPITSVKCIIIRGSRRLSDLVPKMEFSKLAMWKSVAVFEWSHSKALHIIYSVGSEQLYLMFVCRLYAFGSNQ